MMVKIPWMEFDPIQIHVLFPINFQRYHLLHELKLLRHFGFDYDGGNNIINDLIFLTSYHSEHPYTEKSIV